MHRFTAKNPARRRVLEAGAIGLLAALVLPLSVGTLLGRVGTAHAAPAGGRALVIYYSWGGNTRAMAEQIQAVTGADIFELATLTPYPAEYRPTTEQARRELDNGYRPPLAGSIDNLDDYQTIFIGSPNWWGTVAMPFFTFLEAHSLDGKTIVPFMTHEGSGFGNSLNDLKRLCPNATVLEGLAVRGRRAAAAQSEINTWLHKIGLIS